MFFASETVSLNLKWGVLQKLKVALTKKRIDPCQVDKFEVCGGGNQIYVLLMEKKGQGIRKNCVFGPSYQNYTWFWHNNELAH
jgi:hypothetical protein